MNQALVLTITLMCAVNLAACNKATPVTHNYSNTLSVASGSGQVESGLQDIWVVKLTEGTDAKAWAEELGVDLLRGVGELPDTYSVDIPGSATNSQLGEALLSNSPQVTWYQQQYGGRGQLK